MLHYLQKSKNVYYIISEIIFNYLCFFPETCNYTFLRSVFMMPQGIFPGIAIYCHIFQFLVLFYINQIKWFGRVSFFLAFFFWLDLAKKYVILMYIIWSRIQQKSWICINSLEEPLKFKSGQSCYWIFKAIGNIRTWHSWQCFFTSRVLVLLKYSVVNINSCWYQQLLCYSKIC